MVGRDGNSSGPQRQMQIYQAGNAGARPSQPIAPEDLETAAREALSLEAFDYVAGGAGSEDTMRANLDAFRQWRIVPRFLRDVARRDLSVELFDVKIPSPILLAPIGVLGIVHDDAELPVARATSSVGVPFIVSSVSTHTMEAIAEAMGDCPRWFQLYWPKLDDLTTSFLSRAEQAGYSAIVVTLDTYLLGWRERDLNHAYLPFFTGNGLANYICDPVFAQALGEDPRANPEKSLKLFTEIFSDPSHTWDHLAKLCQQTKLPVLVKGALHPDDARQALDVGVAGIIVSNHGGRQVDGERSALDALPDIVDAVGDQTTVLFDSGIRRGADIVKALALGAKSVLLGRPYCYGLAIRGEQGVREVLLNLLADLDLTLGLTGCASLAELTREHLHR